MWSDRRTLLALGAAFALAACGFQPAYGPGAPATALRDRIDFAAPSNEMEFAFVARAEDRLGRPNPAAYRLAYRITTGLDALAVTPDQEIQRYNLTGRLVYSVTDAAGETVLTRGQIDSFTAYSAIGTTVATRASERDAVRRLGVILADMLATELVATAGAWAR